MKVAKDPIDQNNVAEVGKMLFKRHFDFPHHLIDIARHCPLRRVERFVSRQVRQSVAQIECLLQSVI